MRHRRGGGNSRAVRESDKSGGTHPTNRTLSCEVLWNAGHQTPIIFSECSHDRSIAQMPRAAFCNDLFALDIPREKCTAMQAVSHGLRDQNAYDFRPNLLDLTQTCATNRPANRMIRTRAVKYWGPRLCVLN